MLITAPRVVPASPGSGVLAPGYVALAGGLVTEVGQGQPPRAAGPGRVKVVPLAPEVDGGMAAVRQLSEAGVLVSVGHSDATAAQVAAAAGAGARMITHLYNAQRPLHHREPGVVGQALADA